MGPQNHVYRKARLSGHSLPSGTGVAKAFEDNAFPDDRERAGDGFGDVEVGITVVFKIDDFAAGRAVQVTGAVDIRIEAFAAAKHFHHADVGKGYQAAVDRIEGDMREVLFTNRNIISALGCRSDWMSVRQIAAR